MQNIVIGHRGAAGYAPENTLVSFHKAFELGCRYIEFDVMLSLDGEAFVFHDDKLNRTTNGRGGFGQVNSAYLKTLNAGSWFSPIFDGVKIPTFKEALQWLIEHEMQANIEIKPYGRAIEQTTMSVLSHIQLYWPANKAWPLVSSFEYQALLWCHQRHPALPLGLLLHRWRADWFSLAKEINCVSIHLNRHIATASRIQDIKNQGYQVLIYTVNERAVALSFFQLGVDGVFSDYPDLLS